VSAIPPAAASATNWSKSQPTTNRMEKTSLLDMARPKASNAAQTKTIADLHAQSVAIENCVFFATVCVVLNSRERQIGRYTAGRNAT